MKSNYLTITAATEGIYKEKGSRFLAFAFPVNTVEEIQRLLQRLKKEHHKARHHCYAYILNPQGNEYRVFDDGEPKHSAGDPIMGQLRARDLTNVLLVVVRYFGGTKLGIGGLISAYRNAAISALNRAKIVKKEQTDTWVLTYPYSKMDIILNLVKQQDLDIIEHAIDDPCKIKLDIPLSKQPLIMGKLEAIPGIEMEP